MKRSKRILEFLIKKGHINLDDFYSINISQWNITLQGLYTHTKAKKYTPKGSVDDCGFVKKDYKIGSILIHVILTS